MAHELIDVVTATPVGPVEIGIGQSVDISASFTLDGPTDATVSIYDIVWQNITDSVGFGSQIPALPNTIYTKTFTPASVGTKIVRCTATFNSDATPPNNLQVVNASDIVVVVKRFREEDAVAGVSMVEEEAPAAAMTEERDPGSITFTESSPAATVVFSEEEAATGGSGTAFSHLDTGEEATVGDYDIYVCESIINGTTLDANVGTAPLKLCYAIATEASQSAVAYWVGMRTAINTAVGEDGYFHSALPYDQTTRVSVDAGLWLLKPSATLGDALGDYFAANVPAYFDGAYADQSFGDLPAYYWTAYQAAHDFSGNQAFWEAALDAHMAAFFAAFKAGFGASRAVIGNTAGATFSGIDGITIEDSKIISMGEAAARAAFETQRTNWQNSSNRYGDHVLNIAWDYNLNIAGLVYEGTTTGAAIPPVAEPFVEEASAS